ncbi:MAG: NADH-quinone oxidoreductase subunit L, partial [Bellilinea sp.]
GLAALYSLTGTLNYQAILNNPAVLNGLAGAASPLAGISWAGLIGILLIIGTIGKSALFPLHIWLPDAMEGPTPVSAMIHAATMVSAGVYLVIRFFPLLSVGWDGHSLTLPMLVMGTIGAFTALFAATIAVAQNDIKRVLAYSTISQLGYMIAALGVGAYVAAAFHLVTHAFFKALLFLGSGSVIHGMEHGVLSTGEKIDPQNMLYMGGLRKKMPLTFWTFLAGGLALSGFPLITAGFWSKDEILAGAYASGQTLIFWTLAAAALLTAFYTMRQITLTFLGQPRSLSAEHAHESRPVMTIPLVILALFAVTAGWVGIPEYFPLVGGALPNWFEEFVGSMLLTHGEKSHHSLLPLTVSLVVALGGLLLGWLTYRRALKPEDPLENPLGGVYSLLRNKYYVDEFYQLVFIRPARWLAETLTDRWLDRAIIDGALHSIAGFGVWLGKSLRRWIDLPVINGAGDLTAVGTRNLGAFLRSLQSGRVQVYATVGLGLAAVVAILIYFLWVIG